MIYLVWSCLEPERYESISVWSLEWDSKRGFYCIVFKHWLLSSLNIFFFASPLYYLTIRPWPTAFIVTSAEFHAALFTEKWKILNITHVPRMHLFRHGRTEMHCTNSSQPYTSTARYFWFMVHSERGLCRMVPEPPHRTDRACHGEPVCWMGPGWQSSVGVSASSRSRLPTRDVRSGHKDRDRHGDNRSDYQLSTYDLSGSGSFWRVFIPGTKILKNNTRPRHWYKKVLHYQYLPYVIIVMNQIISMWSALC